jgi:hypothetical protein
MVPLLVVVGCARGGDDNPFFDQDGAGGKSDTSMPCTAMCGGGCADLKTDPNDCGKCGKACPMNAMCVQGSCQCPAGRTRCGNACVDVKSDVVKFAPCDA